MIPVSMSNDCLLGQRFPTADRGSRSTLSSHELPRWLLCIPGVNVLVSRLGISEFRRRLLHMSPGLLPLLLWFIPHQDPWGPLLINITIMTAVSLIVYAMISARLFARPGEGQWSMAVAGYALPVLAMLLLLPGRSELGLMTLGVIALGDGSAALGGLAFGGQRLPWNSRKTWTGLVSFFTVASAMSALFYWIEARPTVPFTVALLIAGTTAFCGAVIESLPIRSHDNLRVGATAALTGTFLQFFLLGW